MKRQGAVIGLVAGAFVVVAAVGFFLALVISGAVGGSGTKKAAESVQGPASTESAVAASDAGVAPVEATDEWVKGQLQKFVNAYSQPNGDVEAWLAGVEPYSDEGFRASMRTMDVKLAQASAGEVTGFGMMDETRGLATVQAHDFSYDIMFTRSANEDWESLDPEVIWVEGIDYSNKAKSTAFPLHTRRYLQLDGSMLKEIEAAYAITYGQFGGLTDDQREKDILAMLPKADKALKIKRTGTEDVAIRVAPAQMDSVGFLDPGDGRLVAQVHVSYFPDGMSATQTQIAVANVYLERSADGEWKAVDIEGVS